MMVAGALALSVSFAACGSSSGNNTGTGGNTSVNNGTGGATGTGGMAAGTGGSTGTDGGTDTGSTTDPHTVHLGIINKATTGGVPVNRPAPAISYSDCKI
jgi:hypothetical protein